MDSYSILVVDDEPFILDIFSQFLCDEGFNVQVAYSNDEALTYLDHSTFDLILIDLHMKGMLFQEFLTIVRNQGGLSEIPILVVTGIPDALDYKSSQMIQGVIEKPFAPELLISNVKSLLANNVFAF